MKKKCGTLSDKERDEYFGVYEKTPREKMPKYEGGGSVPVQMMNSRYKKGGMPKMKKCYSEGGQTPMLGSNPLTWSPYPRKKGE